MSCNSIILLSKAEASILAKIKKRSICYLAILLFQYQLAPPETNCLP